MWFNEQWLHGFGQCPRLQSETTKRKDNNIVSIMDSVNTKKNIWWLVLTTGSNSEGARGQ